MAHRDDRAIKRASVGRTMIVAHPDQNLAPAEIRQACNQSYGPPVYMLDIIIIASISFALGGLALAVDSKTAATLLSLAAFAVPAAILILVPIARRIEAKDVLSRLDLDNALEVDLPHAEIELEASRLTRQWGRESKVRRRHLEAAWSLASAGIEHSSGHQMRHRNGTCQGCGATDKQWCADTCTLLDPADYR